MNEKRNGENMATATAPDVRCVIYTRKSTTEGLDSNFSSLDAQREACEAFIKSQASAGWRTLPIQYDDGGFTGGNMERPAFQQMITDIKEGQIDCVVVYKIDRLSRSLLDFAKMMEIFDRHNVSFVSITQEFNTSTSMGRLMLNILLSFAQFEREIISERTRDKIAAARKKGKWVGGYPVLGYDIDPLNRRLVVNEEEAEKVRAVLDIFIETRSFSDTLERLNEKGMTTKTWTTRKGKVIESRPFNRARLICLLSNPLYIGKVPYKGEMYDGEHEAIIEPETWSRAREILSNGCAVGRSAAKTKQNGLLTGILRCASCDAPMTRTYAMKKGKKYSYYVCSNAHRNGWKSCSVKSVNAEDIESFVSERLRDIGGSEEMMREIAVRAAEEHKREKKTLDNEKDRLEKDVTKLNTEIARLTRKNAGEKNNGNGENIERHAEIGRLVETASARVAAINGELMRLEGSVVNESEVKRAFTLFDTIWEVLHPKEQSRIAHLVLDRVDYGGQDGAVSMSFNPSGIRALAAEMKTKRQPGGRRPGAEEKTTTLSSKLRTATAGL
jgi:site-specific DNA recombinase